MGSLLGKLTRSTKNTSKNDTPDVQSDTPTVNFPSSSAAGSSTESLDNDNAFQRQKLRSSLQNAVSKQRVRAISDYEANMGIDINFNTGDIMEVIIDISKDGYYSVKNTKSLKTGYIPANKVRKIVDEIEAQECFCDINRETVEDILHESDVEPGAYVIRPSNDEDSYVLSVLCQNEVKRCQVRHYKITATFDRTCNIHANDSGALSFPSVKEMIKHCSEEPILGNKLTRPYLKYLIALKEVAIDINDIIIGKKLGNGHFATVYEGTLADRPTTTVAVKSLRPAGELSVKDFSEEAYVMHRLRHERLVALIGFCINPKDSGVYIVIEKMSNGALKDLLLKDRGKEINFFTLKTMAIQIAEGMSYLESQNFVHRDLRAANILVADSYNVKIADFGLGRILDQYYKSVHFYVETKGMAFPFKWTAPEALRTMHFTLKSDVWSFGILLYEIFTYGEEFYLGMSNREAVEWVVKGNRLEKPTRHYCPEKLHGLMLTCWNEEPEERPTFQKIKTILQH